MHESFRHLLPLMLFTTLIIIASGMVLAVGDIYLLLYPWELGSVFLIVALSMIIAVEVALSSMPVDVRAAQVMLPVDGSSGL